MTEEQAVLLSKYGFVLEAGLVKHRKTGIVISVEAIEWHPHADDFRAYIVELLRNQCLWKRAES